MSPSCLATTLTASTVAGPGPCPQSCHRWPPFHVSRGTSRGPSEWPACSWWPHVGPLNHRSPAVPSSSSCLNAEGTGAGRSRIPGMTDVGNLGKAPADEPFVAASHLGGRVEILVIGPPKGKPGRYRGLAPSPYRLSTTVQCRGPYEPASGRNHCEERWRSFTWAYPNTAPCLQTRGSRIWSSGRRW